MPAEDSYSDINLLKRSVDDLLSDRNESRIGLFFANEYRKKIKEIKLESYPQTCLLLSKRIQSAIDDGTISKYDRTGYRAMLNVSRSGLNRFYDRYMDSVTEAFTNDAELIALASDLHCFCALGAYNCNRPFDALSHVQRSVGYAIDLRKRNETNVDLEKELGFRIMDKMS